MPVGVDVDVTRIEGERSLVPVDGEGFRHARRQGVSGEFDPGDGVNFNFGMGLSINDRASFSVGYDHSRFGKNKREGQLVQNTQTQQVGSVLFGLAYRLSLRTNLNLTLGIGATPAAPDIQIGIRLPVTF